MVELESEIGKARHEVFACWFQIVSHLPEDFDPHHKKFVKQYFRAQLRISRDQKTKAARILSGLQKKVGFLDFEEENESLLAAVDLAVRGSTNRKNVEPLFKINNF